MSKYDCKIGNHPPDMVDDYGREKICHNCGGIIRIYEKGGDFVDNRPTGTIIGLSK